MFSAFKRAASLYQPRRRALSRRSSALIDHSWVASRTASNPRPAPEKGEAAKKRERGRRHPRPQRAAGGRSRRLGGQRRRGRGQRRESRRGRCAARARRGPRRRTRVSQCHANRLPLRRAGCRPAAACKLGSPLRPLARRRAAKRARPGIRVPNAKQAPGTEPHAKEVIHRAQEERKSNEGAGR